MGKILPGRFIQSAFLLLIPVVFMIISTTQAPAQDAPSLPADKAAQYNTYISQGDRYLEQGKYREAIAEYNRALLLNPASDEAKQGIIKANQAIANRSAAPSAADIEAERLNFHLAKGTEYYEEAVESYSMDKLAQAVAEWEQALQIDPENKLARSLIQSANRAKVDFLIEKGHDEFFAGNIQEAITVWEDAKKLAPASKVLNDLLVEAHEALHTREMDKIKDDFSVETDKTQEFVSRAGFLPEGASPDGMKRKDISLRPPLPQLRQFGEKEAIVKELSQPVAFEFECESLRGVLKFLTEITGINILVDEEIFNEFGEEEDCYGNKVERKEIFVTIHVSELPLESALNGMLRQHGLGFSIERDFIYVSTPDVLRGSSFEQIETRFYHLKDTSRIALPKLESSGGQTTSSLGGKALNIIGRQSVISGLREIDGSKVLELDSGFEAMSVPKLVEILRTFIPVVLDQSKQTSKRTVRVAEDKDYGGYETGTDPLKLFNSPRQLWADAAGREILSLIDFDPVTNTLIIRNTATNLGMVEVFLDNLDKEPRQISVEAKFITYSITEAERAGIDFEFGGTGPPDETATFDTDSISEGSQINTNLITNIGETILGGNRGGNIFFRFTKADGDFLQITINLLSELTSSRVVSAPRLVTMSNKPAVIQNTTTQSFRSNIDFSTNIVTPEAGQTTTITDVTQEFTDVTSGITLSITPQIQYDNSIRLFILPNVSEVGITDVFTIETASQDTKTVNTITRPRISQQSLFTNVVINDGDTIVVGGMITDKMLYQDTSVPFFRDIPLIGRIFHNKTEFSDAQNLLIFITVNIMDPTGVAYTRLK
jgi:type II secretory pathway component GspD/PulD (secretin)